MLAVRQLPESPRRKPFKALRRKPRAFFFAIRRMYTITRTGSAAAIVQQMRAISASVVPLVTAKALTFTVQKAQASIVQAMGSVFEKGATKYTLGGTRIESATPAKLEARVAVKDRVASGGTLPEDYLFPQVFGGLRKEKRFEKALRLGGLLKSGERALPGDFAKLDAQGNYSFGELRALLNAVAGSKREDARSKTGKRKGRGNRVLKYVFVGTPGGALPGVYRRTGSAKAGSQKLQPLLVFVTKTPSYRKRLAFDEIARETALREFEPTFQRLLLAAARKG